MKTPKELALLAARALSDKKGKEIQALEIADLTTLADYFVLATGSSNTQINALVDNVEKVLHEEAGEDPRGGAPVAGRQAPGPDRRYRRPRVSGAQRRIMTKDRACRNGMPCLCSLCKVIVLYRISA